MYVIGRSYYYPWGINTGLNKGDLAHIKGFIVNKLYYHGCWVGRDGNQIKHHTETNLKSGYEKGKLKHWSRALKQLVSEGIISQVPHMGGELHVSAYHTREAIERGLRYRNAFAEAERLPQWKTDDLI